MSETEQKREAEAQKKRDEERARTMADAQPAAKAAVVTQQNADEVMAIRKLAGSIAEVIEPVQRTRQERTN